MVIAIFMGWARPSGRRRAEASEAGGPWKIVKKVLDKIFQWVPKAYRFPTALIVLGALIMIIPLGISLSTSGGGGGSSPTGSTPSTKTTGG
jgi:hypothetical protein